MATQAKLKDPFDVNLDCIHCGLCLSKCPTYQVLGSEADSPRGRIYLMKAFEDGRIGLDEALLDHVECCLGCRACESACPSGVRYELILNRTRARLYKEHPPSRLQRLAFRRLLPYPGRLRFLGGLLRLYQATGLRRLVQRSGLLKWISGDLAQAEEKLPEIPPRVPLKEVYPPYGLVRRRVALLSGCVMPVFFGPVHRATVEVLRHAGCEVRIPARQRCCGALHSHAGDRESARRLARETVRTFPWEEVDAVLVNSAGCGAAMRDYHHLFEKEEPEHDEAAGFAAKVRDVSEFLDGLEIDWKMKSLNLRVAYDDACHLLHGQKVSSQPRRLLQRIPGINLPPVPNADRCCGSAGIYNLVRPEMADELVDRKLDEILSTRPDRIATGTPGCILQIRYGLRQRGLSIPVQHPMELLHEALRE